MYDRGKQTARRRNARVLYLEEKQKEPEQSPIFKMVVAMTQKSQKKEKEQDFDLER